jgi:hypothetical protein
MMLLDRTDSPLIAPEAAHRLNNDNVIKIERASQPFGPCA